MAEYVYDYERNRIGESIVRCMDCQWFRENATPMDDKRPHFCAQLGIDLENGNGFCSWAVMREDA